MHSYHSMVTFNRHCFICYASFVSKWTVYGKDTWNQWGFNFFDNQRENDEITKSQQSPLWTLNTELRIWKKICNVSISLSKSDSLSSKTVFYFIVRFDLPFRSCCHFCFCCCVKALSDVFFFSFYHPFSTIKLYL